MSTYYQLISILQGGDGVLVRAIWWIYPVSVYKQVWERPLLCLTILPNPSLCPNYNMLCLCGAVRAVEDTWVRLTRRYRQSNKCTTLLDYSSRQPTPLFWASAVGVNSVRVLFWNFRFRGERGRNYFSQVWEQRFMQRRRSRLRITV